jgi:flagellar protein FliS
MGIVPAARFADLAPVDGTCPATTMLIIQMPMENLSILMPIRFQNLRKSAPSVRYAFLHTAMSYNPYGSHLDTKVLTATPLQLIYLVYEGILDAIRDARAHLTAGRIPERSRSVSKALALLNELDGSLDHQRGGDLSLQLARLYEYMRQRLCEANFKQIDEPLAEVFGLVETIAASWRELAEAELTTVACETTPLAGKSTRWIGGAVDQPKMSTAYTI